MPQNRFYSFDIVNVDTAKPIAYSLIRLNGIHRSIEKAEEEIRRLFIASSFYNNEPLFLTHSKLSQFRYETWRQRSLEQHTVIANQYVKQVGDFFIFKTDGNIIAVEKDERGAPVQFYDNGLIDTAEFSGEAGEEILRPLLLDVPDFNSEDNVVGGEAAPFAPNLPDSPADALSAVSMEMAETEDGLEYKKYYKAVENIPAPGRKNGATIFD